jgi:hypothetical protein
MNKRLIELPRWSSRLWISKHNIGLKRSREYGWG